MDLQEKFGLMGKKQIYSPKIGFFPDADERHQHADE